jgi:hypothetical protein
MVYELYLLHASSSINVLIFYVLTLSCYNRLLSGLVRIDMLIDISKHSMKTDLLSYKVSNDLHQQH